MFAISMCSTYLRDFESPCWSCDVLLRPFCPEPVRGVVPAPVWPVICPAPVWPAWPCANPAVAASAMAPASAPDLNHVNVMCPPAPRWEGKQTANPRPQEAVADRTPTAASESGAVVARAVIKAVPPVADLPSSLRRLL